MKQIRDQSSKPDRKIIERNRRNQMKSLCFKLTSMIPSEYFKIPKDLTSQQDQLGVAACYIKQMRERIEELKKEQAMMKSLLKPDSRNGSKMDNNNNNNNNDNETNNNGSNLPVFDLRDLGSNIEVVLISGLQRNFMLYEVISILEEEGAAVFSVSVSTVGDKIFHTIHAQVKILRLGVEISRVQQRLHDLVY